jgi:hypothetical protein
MILFLSTKIEFSEFISTKIEFSEFISSVTESRGYSLLNIRLLIKHVFTTCGVGLGLRHHLLNRLLRLSAAALGASFQIVVSSVELDSPLLHRM